MTETEKLEQEAYEHNVPVDYIKFRSERINGLYVDGSIALRDGMTAAQTADTLAEELEHHYRWQHPGSKQRGQPETGTPCTGPGL